MNIWRNKSLRVKLALWSVLCVFIIVLAVRGLGAFQTTTFLIHHHEQNISSLMEMAVLALKDPLRTTDYLALHEQADILVDVSGITGVRIQDANGHILTERGSLDGTHIQTPIQGDRPLGSIMVSFTRQPLIAGLTAVLKMEGAALALFLVASFAGLWWLSGRYLKDLRELALCIRDGACAISERYPGQERRDEIGFLAWTIKTRDSDLAVYQKKLEEYKDELEDKVEARTRELNQAKQLSETILNSIPDAISLIQIQDCVVLDVNSAFESQYQMSKEEIIGRSCFEIQAGKIADCENQKQRCPVTGYFEQNQPTYCEQTLELGPRKRLHVEVSAWPVHYDQDSEIIHMVHVQRDVTERKRLERQRKDVEQIVRHDLKSPLNGIFGMAQLLEMDLHSGDEHLEYVQHIKGSVHKLLHMIHSSMDLHRMEEGTYRVQAAEVDLLEILASLQKEWQHLANKKNLKMQILVNGQPPGPDQTLVIEGEKDKLESMLANLVVNALEASPPAQKVTFSITSVKDSLHIDIHNWGEIPEQIKDHFFERYVTAGKERGTGLGTYSARLVARAHGGDISFSSSVQAGTNLFIDLPLPPSFDLRS
ncbi:MAG: ATP-binding protein [Desulfovermiculus sp.]